MLAAETRAATRGDILSFSIQIYLSSVVSVTTLSLSQ
jgi:hypothetical protein